MSDPDHASVDAKREQFQRLRQDVLAQVEREAAERIARNPTPTEEKVRAGAFREMIESQCRDAAFAMRRKGYATESSGFGGTHGEVQQIDGNFEIDAETEARLRAIGVIVHRSGDPGEVLAWRTALQFTPDRADPDAMRAKWDAVAALLPDRGAPAEPGVSGGTEDFIRERAPHRTDLLDRIAELRQRYDREQGQVINVREGTARETAARRERQEKVARARDISDARRVRAELGHAIDPTTEELQSLILSADAEAQVSREFGERGETGPHLFRGVDGEQRLTVFGTAHVFDRAEVGDLRRAFEEASPDLVLREGTVDFAIDPTLSDEQVLERYGEQVYLERLARAKGIEVRSWDVPWEETMRDAIAHGHAPEVIVAWMMAQGTKHLLKQGRVPSREALAEILKVVRSPAVVEALRRDTGFEFDPDRFDLDRIAREHLGKPLAELDFDTAEAHANPWQRGPTNDVLRRMNELRDARAIALIAEAKRAGKHAFVLAGGDHVLAWQPALEALYPQHEFETFAESSAT